MLVVDKRRKKDSGRDNGPAFCVSMFLFSWDVLSHLDMRFPPWDDPELLIDNNGWTRSVGRAIPGEGGKGRTQEQGKETLQKIGKRFKQALQLKDNEAVEFSGHTDAAHSGSTRAKAKFTV